MAHKSTQALTGKAMNAVIVTPQYTSVANIATGVLSDGDVVGAQQLVDGTSLYGHVEDVSFDQEYETEEATMLGSLHCGEVSGPKRVTCTLTEILKYQNGNLLQAVFNAENTQGDGDDVNTRIVKVTIKRAATSFIFYGNIRSYRETYRKGKCIGVMVITGIDPQGNLGYTADARGTLGLQPTIASYSPTGGI